MLFNTKEKIILSKALFASANELRHIMSTYDSFKDIQKDIDHILNQGRFKSKAFIADIIKHYNPSKEERFVSEHNIGCLTFLDKDYPDVLHEIDSGPAILFYKGDLSCFEKDIISVIGPRKASEYGKQVAQNFSAELAKHFCICSGFAVGIDYIAHTTTVKCNQQTIAVLGSDFSNNYPAHHHQLSKEILDNNGLILSEIPLFTKPSPYHFRFRNRIISGLSRGVLICEATTKSGTLVTAQCAVDQNREIFAVPGSIFSKESEGTLSLIQQGAKCTLHPKDIYDELNIYYPDKDIAPLFETKTPLQTKPLSEDEKTIVNILSSSQSLDDIVAKTKLPLSKTLHYLSVLEINNIIKKQGQLFELNTDYAS